MGWLDTLGSIGNTVGQVVNNPLTQLGVGWYNNRQTQNAIGDANQSIQQGFNQSSGILQDYANASLGTLNDAYQQGVDWVQPFQQAGVGGLEGYQGLLNDPSSVMQNPGVQFQFDQGLEALNRNAASQGFRNSGNAMAAATQYGQDYASTAYDQALNRYLPMVQSGQNAGNTLANLGYNYAGGVVGVNNALSQGLSGNAISQGMWNANSTLGGANAQTGFLNDLLNIGSQANQAGNMAGAANSLSGVGSAYSQGLTAPSEIAGAALNSVGIGSGSSAAGLNSAVTAAGGVAPAPVVNAAAGYEAGVGIPSMSGINSSAAAPYNPSDALFSNATGAQTAPTGATTYPGEIPAPIQGYPIDQAGTAALTGVNPSVLAEYNAMAAAQGLAPMTAEGLASLAASVQGGGALTGAAGTWVGPSSAQMAAGSGGAAAGGLGLLGTAGVALAALGAIKAISGSGTGGVSTKLSKLSDSVGTMEQGINGMLSGQLWHKAGTPEPDNAMVIAKLIQSGALSYDDPRVKAWEQNFDVNSKGRKLSEIMSSVEYRPDLPEDVRGDWMKALDIVHDRDTQDYKRYAALNKIKAFQDTFGVLDGNPITSIRPEGRWS